jgi:CSLREA domain-containing protein
MGSCAMNLLPKKTWKSGLGWFGMSLLVGAAMVVYSLNLTQPASAASITVNSFTDVVADDGKCTLREAIKAANQDNPSGSMPEECPAGSGADVVSLPAGMYLLSPGSAMHLNSEMEIVGEGQAITTIHGLGATQIFYRSSSPSHVTIRDLTLQGGAASSGGAFEQSNASTTFEHVTFYNNSAVEMGGAITNSSGELTLIDCLLHFNVAENAVISSNNGGAIRNAGGTLSIIRSQFNYNSVDPDEVDGRGGAIFSDGSGAQVNLEDSSFIGNVAGEGGAVYSRGITTISGSTFSSNNSTYSPGALNSSLLVLKNSTFSQNSNGGLATTGVDAWVLSSTFYDNNTGAANITKISGTTTIKNSILVSLSGGTNCSGTITSGGYNLDNNSTCGLSGTGDQSGVDPMLGQLLDNGGPAHTHALKYGSPAIDAGNPAGCTDDLGSPILTDQRGNPRSIDGNVDGTARCDIGAYEAEPFVLFLPLIMR